jgi:membrane protease YdiL (CAAX protease family)
MLQKYNPMAYTDKTLLWGTARTSLVFALITLTSVAFFGGIGFMFSERMYGIQSPTGMRWAQFSIALGLFLMPPLFFASLSSNDPLKFLGLRKLPTYLTAPHSRKNATPLPPTYHTYLALLLLTVGCFFAVDLLSRSSALLPNTDWVQGLREQEELVQATLSTLLADMTITTLLVNGIVMVLVPALGEELFFRGVLLKLFNRTFDFRKAALFSAVFFALAHQQPLTFLPIFFMGLTFAYVKMWTGTLWAPILMHAINNGFALGSAWMNEGVLETTSPLPLYATLLGVIPFIAGAWWLRQIQRRHTAWVR